jgi:DNA primase
LLKKTTPYLDYIIKSIASQHDISRPSGKQEVLNAILPHLNRLRFKEERYDQAAQIAKLLNIDDRLIIHEIKKAAARRQPTFDLKRFLDPEKITKGERQLLELMLANCEVRRAMVSVLVEEDYAELATAAIFKAVVDIHSLGLEPDFDNITGRLESESERALLPALLMSDLAWAGGEDFDTLFKKATEALSSLRRRRFERMLDAIQIEIGQAERDRDVERVLLLYQQKTEIQRRRLALAVV